MATVKPRITITLDQEKYELLRRLASYQGSSMSSIVADLLDAVAPVLERVCVAIEGVMQAQDGVREGLKRAAEESERAIMPHLTAAMSQLDAYVERCQKVEGDEKDPRTVITGVRSPVAGGDGSDGHAV